MPDLNLVFTSTLAYGLARRQLPGGTLITRYAFIPMIFGGGLIPSFILNDWLHPPYDPEFRNYLVRSKDQDCTCDCPRAVPGYDLYGVEHIRRLPLRSGYSPRPGAEMPDGTFLLPLDAAP